MALPIRYARSHPLRALLIGIAALVFTAAAVAAVVLVWFNHHLDRARLSVERWHNADAFVHLSKCQRIRPDQKEVLILSARLARRVGTWPEAESILDRYLEAYGEDEALAFERLLHRASRGDMDGIAEGLRAHIAEGGQKARLAREALVLGFTGQFRLVEALSVIDQWLHESPDDPIALLLLGKVTEGLGGQERAIQIYTRVIELDPDLLDARLQLATVLVERRLGDLAAEQLAVLRVRLPQNMEVSILWSQTLSLLGRTSEARQVLDSLLIDHPDNSKALAERGGLALIDEDRRAIDLLRKATQLDPSNISARNLYALALARNGLASEAAEEYKQIKQLEADSERFRELIRGPLQSAHKSPSTYQEIGMIALRGGQTRDAIRWFEQALQVDPNYLPTHRTLTVIYQELDNPILAAKHRAIAQKLSTQTRP